MPYDYKNPKEHSFSFAEEFSYVTAFDFYLICTEALFNNQDHDAAEYCQIRTSLSYFDLY